MATGSTGHLEGYDYLRVKYEHLFTSEDRRAFAMFGFECGDGWYEILEQLLDHIDSYFKHKHKGVPEGFCIAQIKEKFGGLRVYCDGADDVVHELINFASTLSYRTCEFCGSNQNVQQSQGWIVTACQNCIESHERLQGRTWHKLNSRWTS